jgi:uncharacterized protein YbaP (TraB family)
MLWHIENSNTYLLGSIHATNMQPLELPHLAEQAFSRSSCVVFETDLDGAPDQSLLTLPDGMQLADLVSESLFRITQTHWLRLGLPESRMLALRPGFVAMNLQFTEAAQSGYTPQLGIDRNLWERAKREGKECRELEPFRDQLRMLAESPLEEQVSLLSYIANQSDVGLSELTGMVAAWRSQDTVHFDRLLKRRLQAWPNTFEVLITKRNKNWVPSIVALAQSGAFSLVIAGLFHFFGPTGLPTLLQQHGLRLAIKRDV